MSESRRGERNPMFGKSLSEERRKQSSLPGPLNPRWNGGTSFLPYPSDFTRTLKARIRERDSYVCQLCGVPESECLRKLDIHHIDHKKENLSDSNLLSLCRACNAKVNSKREYWQQHFQAQMTEV